MRQSKSLNWITRIIISVLLTVIVMSAIFAYGAPKASALHPGVSCRLNNGNYMYANEIANLRDYISPISSVMSTDGDPDSSIVNGGVGLYLTTGQYGRFYMNSSVTVATNAYNTSANSHIIFEIQNHSNESLGFKPISLNNCSYSKGAFYLIDSNHNLSAKNSGDFLGNGWLADGASVPAGFQGYIAFPFSSFSGFSCANSQNFSLQLGVARAKLTIHNAANDFYNNIYSDKVSFSVGRVFVGKFSSTDSFAGYAGAEGSATMSLTFGGANHTATLRENFTTNSGLTDWTENILSIESNT